MSQKSGEATLHATLGEAVGKCVFLNKYITYGFVALEIIYLFVFGLSLKAALNQWSLQWTFTWDLGDVCFIPAKSSLLDGVQRKAVCIREALHFSSFSECHTEVELSLTKIIE